MWRSRNNDARDLDIPLVQSNDVVAPPQPPERVAPESRAGCWYTITFGWLNKLIAEGYRREQRRSRSGNEPPEGPLALTEDDLFELREDDRPEYLMKIAAENWEHEKNLPDDQRSLRRALRKAFGYTYLCAAFFKFIYDSLQMVGPFVLKSLLGYLNECKDGACEAREGLQWVGILFASNVLQTVVLHQYFHRCFRSGMRLNAAAIGLIYGKSLRIAGAGKAADKRAGANGAAAGAKTEQQRTSGEIVNLMSVDAQRLQDFLTYAQTLWSGPYQIIITLIFLYYVVSWATFAGVAVMLLQIPVVTMIAKRVKAAQKDLMKIKDERIKITNELFNSMRLIKMYGWEESFQKRLDDIREKELWYLRRYQLLDIISRSIWTIAPLLTSIATFAVYIWLNKDHTLTAGVAFSAMSLFNVLRFPLTMFPNMVTSAVEANLAIKRIESFLTSGEIKGRGQTASPTALLGAENASSGSSPPAVESVPADASASSTSSTAAISIKEASFEWPGGVPLLGNLSLEVPKSEGSTGSRGHLTVILGGVGTGKSGLLQALIGDLTPKTGSVAVAGSIAYSSQVAWIRNATVKDNIVFNHAFDEKRYQDTVKACQLLADFDALPNGDMTEIGEKGVNLSGGQKQRVSLARAVYANANILLLDDPLSAVDSEVAKKLVAMLQGELVQNSSIVLCTHYLGAIQYADQVIVLEKLGKEGTTAASLAETAAEVEEAGTDEGSASPSEGGAGASPAGGGASGRKATTESRVAFSGTVEAFREAYPGIAKECDSVLTRTISEDGTSTEVKEPKKKKEGQLGQAETEFHGSVAWTVYKTYINAAGGMCFAMTVLIGMILGQAFQTSADLWVSYWSDHSADSARPHIDGETGLLGYVITSMFAFVGVIGTSTMFRTTALRASKTFHKQMLASLLLLPTSFYDTTPLGRITSRFSKDIYTVDEQLVSTLMMYFNTLLRVASTIVVICIATPWFLVGVIPLMLIYRYIQNFYIPSSRQLQRIESNLRSPIFSHFGETLDGVACIRAFGQQAQFVDLIREKVQRNMRAYYLKVASNRWLAVRLETIGTIIVTLAGLLAVVGRNNIAAGMAGVSISYALSVTQALNWVVRMTSDREANIVSVERLSEYIQLSPEPPRRLASDPVEGTWPVQGAIEFKDVRLRYRPELPLVLDGLCLSVRPGEKLGICGRTGAGKSSLLNVLLRIVDPTDGTISIDGVNTQTLGLHRVRRAITVLPQDPVLFSGDLRFNLDPLNEASDEALWQAIQRSHLESHVDALAHQSVGDEGQVTMQSRLSATVAEKGENFSLGQRQQMCLARALLRQNKILLLDEATSAVDVETDNLIQQTIRTEFASQTVLCIAHRISTVLASDRVCVVDAGKVGEIGSPQELLATPGSRFKKLAEMDSSR
mmetsp:Transcript_8049/g.17997  ORF Transcript_8049/g.17997 Transcript_8049/m.17997 type:complete len:1401 (-) Transcript_8049:232-4434(-)